MNVFFTNENLIIIIYPYCFNYIKRNFNNIFKLLLISACDDHLNQEYSNL